MKKMFFVLLVSLITAGAHAQLAGTKWGLTIHMNDNDVPTICTFSKDTLKVNAEGDGSLIETMTYTEKDGVLTIIKTEGQSDCGDGPGSYKFEIKDNTMVLTLVKDDCEGRGGVLDKSKWVKK